MTGTTPTFSSPDLQMALENARPLLEGAEAARNRVSADIKALEVYLQGLKLTSEFSCEVAEHMALDCEEGREAEAEFSFHASGGGPVTYRLDHLVFAPDDHGTWRLMHETILMDGSFDMDAEGGPKFYDRTTTRSEGRKPLIETKFETRKAMHACLPGFVQALGESLRVQSLPIEIPSPKG